MTADLHQTRMATAAEPPFEDELGAVWGRPWGAHDEVGALRVPLVRPPGAALDAITADAWDPELGALVDPEGRWYWTRRTPPDPARAAAQHAGLVQTLEREGVEVVLGMLDADLALVDAAGLPFGFLERLGELGIELVHADPDEPWGLNLLALAPRRVLMATGSPRTAERLSRAGVEVLTVDYDELHPAGGGIHCSTMELLREPAR